MERLRCERLHYGAFLLVYPVVKDCGLLRGSGGSDDRRPSGDRVSAWYVHDPDRSVLRDVLLRHAPDHFESRHTGCTGVRPPVVSEEVPVVLTRLPTQGVAERVGYGATSTVGVQTPCLW